MVDQEWNLPLIFVTFHETVTDKHPFLKRFNGKWCSK